jgi:hypothetical protein
VRSCKFVQSHQTAPCGCREDAARHLLAQLPLRAARLSQRDDRNSRCFKVSLFYAATSWSTRRSTFLPCHLAIEASRNARSSNLGSEAQICVGASLKLSGALRMRVAIEGPAALSGAKIAG